MMGSRYILVKHDESDYRLYQPDGTKTGHSWDDCPDKHEVRDAGVPQGCYCFRLAEEVERVS